MKIRLLHFQGCPNAQQALDLLKSILKEKGVDREVEVIEVKSQQDARKYHFLGSPSIQINGLDIEKERREDPPLLGCRIYITKDGYSVIPPGNMIVEAIEEAKKKAKKQKVLFICTHNSARSQMAEGILRALYGSRYQVYSADTKATEVNPYVIKVMSEIDIDISAHRSKIIEEFSGMKFDYVVTVCNHAKETCPFFPDGKTYLHKGFKDPAGVRGREHEIIAEFRRVRDGIKKWIEETFGKETN